MSPDHLLTMLVQNVERGRLPSLYVWIATPAGVFTGQIISAERYYAEAEAQMAGMVKGGEEDGVAPSVAVMAADSTRSEALPRYVHLWNAHLLTVTEPEASQPGVELTLARIELDSVHGWSFFGAL
jgi:hypothetical protein